MSFRLLLVSCAAGSGLLAVVAVTGYHVYRTLTPGCHSARSRLSLDESEWLAFDRWFKDIKCGAGAFVEIGARHALAGRQSHFLGSALGWQGILLEPDPSEISSLKRMLPTAHVYRGTVCSRRQMNLTLPLDHRSSVTTSAKAYMPTPLKERDEVSVPCHWLPTLLKNHQMLCVDYLSIDLEEREESIITEMPWRELPVRVVQLRTRLNLDAHEKRRMRSQLVEHMKQHKYRLAANISSNTSGLTNFIFENRRQIHCQRR
ncbi:hypothetical protein AB1Y20_015242 [Prymnesium parvum]|uniref:Methyltransferase FkbM domain-containing protein n=1 Tax=Prymnesium parvum TaxID=97485 RepID=A0AB34JWH5_PRYPA